MPSESARLPKIPSVWIEYLGLVGALCGLVLGFSVLTDHFLSAASLRTIANQIPPLLLVSTGMTCVLIVGGIDLSVGSVMALCGGVLGIALSKGAWPFPMALAACLATGAACGLFTGGLVSRLGIPSFIVSLGMLEAARGGAYFVTDSRTQYVGAEVDWITSTEFAGLALPFWVAGTVVLLTQAALSYLPGGRHMVAVGYNEESARLSGLDSRKIKLFAFTFAGFLSGLAAVLHTARLSAADPNAGTGLELEAIAAAVIGGTSLSGGRGSVFRTVLGVLIIAVLGNGLAQIGAEESTKRIVTGIVIVVAVIIDRFRRGNRG